MSFKFFDTCIIISTCYLRNINYDGSLTSKDIDYFSDICLNEYNSIEKKIICVNVEQELLRFLKRRSILHDLLIDKLNSFKVDFSEYDSLNPSIIETNRDKKWLNDKYAICKKHKSIEDINKELEDILYIFEDNIRDILMEIFIYNMAASELNSKRAVLLHFKAQNINEKPNYSDIKILTSAILYNTFYDKITFITHDKGYSKIKMDKLEHSLKIMKPELKPIDINIIS